MDDHQIAINLGNEILIAHLLLVSAIAHPDPKYLLDNSRQLLTARLPNIVSNRGFNPEVAELVRERFNTLYEITIKSLPQHPDMFRRE